MASNPNAFLTSEIARLKAENADLQDELNSLREFVLILNELDNSAQSVESDEDLKPILRDILVKALNLVNAADGSLALLDEENNELVFVIVLGDLASELEGFRIQADEGIAGWVMENRQPVLVADVSRDQRFFEDVDDEFKFSTKSIAAAPIIGDGKVMGVIEAILQTKYDTDSFDEHDLELLKLLCRFAGEALTNIERLLPESDD